MDYSIFPPINASLNGLTAILLVVGLVLIKQGKRKAHQVVMIGALVSSTVFLSCYLFYHFHHIVTVFPRHDWTRVLYFSILIPHVILAVLMLPFIFMAVGRGLRGEYERHKALTRWVWPVWMYVSVTGVLVYFMLYRWFT
jgi:uncharacterized membrane protein YozB (DUF420 family)